MLPELQFFVKRLIAEKNYQRNMTEKSLENQYLEPWLLHNTDPLVTQITCVTRMCNVAFFSTFCVILLVNT